MLARARTEGQHLPTNSDSTIKQQVLNSQTSSPVLFAKAPGTPVVLTCPRIEARGAERREALERPRRPRRAPLRPAPSPSALHCGGFGLSGLCFGAPGGVGFHMR